MHEDWRDMYIAQKTAQLGHTAVEVEVQLLDQSLPYHLSEFKPWNKRSLLCVGYCVVLVCRPISNANSLSYSLWFIVKDSNVILNMPTQCGHSIKR